nr:YheC/YheD family protein [Paenibacillus turpanensis]
MEACRLLGVVPCFFTLKQVSIQRRSVKAYIESDGVFQLKTVPIPAVIHNRALYFKKPSIQKASRLLSCDTILFNQKNRYSKWHIHRLLNESDAVRQYLPYTMIASIQNVGQMKQRFDALIIKPRSSSIGIGVMKLEKIGGSWKLSYRPTNGAWKSVIGTKQINRILYPKLRTGRYIVQQYLPLATYKGRPFDLRVSVQRGGNGEWGITGMVCKIAGKRKFVTNVARGGSVRTLEDVLKEYPQLNPERVRKDVEEAAMLIARRLDEELPRLADLGMDIGIAADGTPLFIECNGRDQRYSFRKAGLDDAFAATYRNPMAYAKYLLDTQA